MAPGQGGEALGHGVHPGRVRWSPGLSASTAVSVRTELQALLGDWWPVVGLSSLAEGGDQIFAEAVLGAGGTLVAVVPCRGYEQAFGDESALDGYRSLLARASQVVILDTAEPSEETFWAAGRRVVDEAQRLIAVWNGKPAGGLGGTADVVRYAVERGVEVDVVWPDGALTS